MCEWSLGHMLRGDFKYYFADFVRRGGGGTPQIRYPIFAKMFFLVILVQKIGYGFGGYPPPPLYGFFSAERELGFGGYPPPPLRTKSAK